VRIYVFAFLEHKKVNPQSGSIQLGSEILFNLPQFGDFIHDIAVHVILKQPTMVYTTATPSDQPLMRWCDYPGERLFQHVQFEVNGNLLDEYYYSAYNFYRQFCVQPNKQTGWNRLMGQEEPVQGFVDQPNWVRSGVMPSSIVSRMNSNVCTGFQTPTGQKDQTADGDLEMIVPLLLWYCVD